MQSPVFLPVSSAVLTTANAVMTGAGVVSHIYQAPVQSKVHMIIWRSLGSNVATVGRLFINNGLDNNESTNNSLIDEITLPLTTASSIIATRGQLMDMPIWVPANYKLFVTLGTTVVAGYKVTAFAGPYEGTPLVRITA